MAISQSFPGLNRVLLSNFSSLRSANSDTKNVSCIQRSIF